ncbi:hypothetical protein BWQ96_03638 [Gracilariopsis chorda]|uniref:Signal recognition particle SRP54 subunit M-domain domain-containing protein n=1 Tax=Gracilariopsis chorda TaxID=448386 RepID=A0A2V3IX19_9FLOR|nr:hypothetical protein BWQ96_03638 [Gracilariopsis chorda]|eukprot:PXF46649.1 hypothetical protein BWQ96_03638 [Gracilariopsis chorda]
MKSAYGEAQTSAEEKRSKKMFQIQMGYLRGKEMMTPNVFLSALQKMKQAAGLSGVKEHLPWVQNNPALGEFKQQESIIAAMTPSEKKDAFSITISDKKRIMRAADAPMEAVEALVTQITQMRRIQKWMWKREKEGLPIPRSADELERMIVASGGVKGAREHHKYPNPGVPEKGRTRRWAW